MTICIDIYAFKRGHIRKSINAMPYFSGVKVLIITPKKAGVHAAYPQLLNNHSTHSTEITGEECAYKLLTQLPVLYLKLREGAGVDAGVGRGHEVRDF